MPNLQMFHRQKEEEEEENEGRKKKPRNSMATIWSVYGAYAYNGASNTITPGTGLHRIGGRGAVVVEFILKLDAILIGPVSAETTHWKVADRSSEESQSLCTPSE